VERNNLKQIVKEIEREAEKRNFVIFPVTSLDTDLPQVASSHGLVEFLNIASSLGIKILYLHTQKYTEVDFLECLEERSMIQFERFVTLHAPNGGTTRYGDSISNGTSIESLRTRLYRIQNRSKFEAETTKLKEFQKEMITLVREGCVKNRRYDQLESITCFWVLEGLAHSITYDDSTVATEAEASIDPAITKILSESSFRHRLEECLQDNSEDEVKEPLLSDSKTQESANIMAQHERFVEAKSEAKRVYMAGQLFPKESPESLASIAEQAFLIHWWHYEPMERSVKLDRALSLHQKGVALEHISGNLQIPKSQIKEAIAQKRLNTRQEAFDLDELEEMPQ